jgi:hypothetical protein
MQAVGALFELRSLWIAAEGPLSRVAPAKLRSRRPQDSNDELHGVSIAWRTLTG